MTDLSKTEEQAPWPDEYVAYDFTEAISTASPVAPATPGASAGNPVAPGDVAEVTDWYVTYNGGPPYVAGSGDTGTELTLIAILRLKDGRWAALQGWNDYTGWGCQDGAEMKVGESREQVVRFGLDDDGRRKLGLSL